MSDHNGHLKILVSIKEAAELLSVSKNTIRKYIDKNELSKVSLERCVRIPYSSLLELINNNLVIRVSNRELSIKNGGNL